MGMTEGCYASAGLPKRCGGEGRPHMEEEMLCIIKYAPRQEGSIDKS